MTTSNGTAATATAKKGTAMNSTLKTIIVALKLFQTYAPTMFTGLEGFIAALKGQTTASTATAAPTTLADVHELAEQHGVDMHKVAEVLDQKLAA